MYRFIYVSGTSGTIKIVPLIMATKPYKLLPREKCVTLSEEITKEVNQDPGKYIKEYT